MREQKQSPKPIPALPKKLRTLAPLAIAILAVLLLVGSVADLEFKQGQPLPIGAVIKALREMRPAFTGIGPLPFDPLRLLAAMLWIVLITTAILFIISPEVRREMLKRIMIYTVWTLIFYGILQLVIPHLAQLELFGQEPGVASDEFEEGAPDDPLPTPPEFVVNPPQWLVIMTTILTIAIPLVVGWVVWIYLNKRNKAPPEPDSLEQITRQAQNALDDLEAGANFSDTVLRCYHQMTRVLARERNLHRSQAMTPREFEHYLAQSGLRTKHIHRLTRLFENTRYGDSTPNKRAEVEAIDCLNAIVRSYGSKPLPPSKVKPV